MRLGDKSLDLSPEEFERATRRFFDVAGIRLDSFETKHREKIKASDGIGGLIPVLGLAVKHGQLCDYAIDGHSRSRFTTVFLTQSGTEVN
jgi:hypothetical protein